MRIRDPIHNFIEVPDEFAPVVGSRPLQRLRGIRQLALASLVYPGALHTRFDHTLGVFHVADLMAKQLGLRAEEVRLIRLATLLHDVGHGPFSHVSEASLDRFADRAALSSDQEQHKIHELVTAAIIRTDSNLAKIIPEPDREAVIQLLGDGGGSRPVCKQMVSGPLDADKQDYLLRDSHFCGVEYGTYDLHQLQRSLQLVATTGEDHELMIDGGGIHAVEQFVLAKYYMTANVYRHKVRLITDQMIGRAIRLGIEADKLELLARLYRYDGTPAFIANYQQWDDSRFWETFCPVWENPPGAKSGALLRRLRSRELLKLGFRNKVGDLHVKVRELVPNLPRPEHDGVRGRIEARIAEFLTKELDPKQPIDADLVILHAFDIKSARETSRNEQEEVLVNDGTTPKMFTEASTLFRSINEAYSDKFVEVYAPIAWPDPRQKTALRERWKLGIRDLIEAECLANRSGVKP